MRAVYRKELRQYFRSVIGWLFLAIFLFISGYYFVLQNLMNRSGDISVYFRNVISFMMFLMPMLTMRSFAEEKKQRTDQLLLTMPIRTWDVVLGKFCAALTVLAAGMGVTLCFPVILAFYDSLELWVTLGNYLAMLLLLGCFLSIGIFVSALTENQIVAAIGTYVILFGLWFSSGFSGSIQNQQLLDALSSLSLMEKYYEMALGVFNPASMLLYATLTGLFLFFTRIVLEGRLCQLWAYSLLVVLASVSVNTMTTEAVNRFGWKLDMTEAGLFKLSDITRETGEGLTEPVELIYLNSQTRADSYVSQMLERYETLSGQISVEFVDITQNPSFTADYTARGIPLKEDSVVVRSSRGEEILEWEDLYEFSGNGQTGYMITGFAAERRLTSAILKVTGESSHSAVLVQGHSEQLSEALEELLRTAGYETRRQVLDMEELPDTVDTVVIAGPTKDYSLSEIEKLDAFLKRGGSLLVFRGADDGNLPELDSYLAEWGIIPQELVVLEPSQQIDTPINLVPSFASHLINVYFSQNQTYLELPRTRSFAIDSQGSRAAIPVLNSSPDAYGRSLTEDLSDLNQREGDVEGPFVLAATSEASVTVEGKEGRAHVFVCGSSSFYTEELLGSAHVGNSDLILQALAWCNEEEAQVNIPAKSMGATQIAITRTSVLGLAWVFLGLLPGGLLLWGVGIFFRRRHL
ncbi:MAG: ABC transporter permease subunit [Lachnospiraceae bacterium]|nr:ABC transporter permease subunit [Lachnospiraceae bacterium]